MTPTECDVVSNQGQCGDKVVDVGSFRSGDDLLHGNAARVVAVRDVLANAHSEQDRVLRHDADLRAQPADVELLQH